MRFKLWENKEYDLLVANLIQKTPKILGHPAVQNDLNNTGYISIKTLKRALGMPEGEANFTARELNKRYGRPDVAAAAQQKSFQSRNDEYYYHVTLKSRLPSILKSGLVPDSDPTFTNYTYNTKGRIFLGEKESVPYWQERVSNHEESNTDYPQGTVVLRIKKVNVPEVLPDQLGENDSKSPSYYATSKTPPHHIEIVA